MNQNRYFRQSRDGYAFDENENFWRISKDKTINFSQHILNINKKTLDGFRKTLAIYAEKYSSYHVSHMYQQFQRLVISTNLEIINVPIILDWKNKLGKEHEWYLGALKGFLLSWHEYGYYGVDKSVVSLLESFTLSENEKGKSVLMRCPYTGAFTENEVLALMAELARLWREDLISFETYAYIHLLQSTARRPIQIRHLKFEDLRKEISQGTWNSISGFKMKLPMFIDWNCLKRNIKNRNFDLSLLDKDIFHYSASSLEQNALRKFCIHQKAISERTGEIIHVTARRFRHTRGTNLGRKGVGATIIAELLDHTDTQNVKVYTENTADTVQYIDRVMGAEMGKLAQAFTGRIISNLNESERGHDPTSLITNNGIDTIGACGTNDFCITSYETCYLCPKFRPLVDGPHQQILNKLYEEKEERLKQTKSIDYASSKDRIILAVEYVVQACNDMKRTIGSH